MTVDDAALDQLVAEAKAGDAEAFAALFDLYHVRVYRYIANRVQRPADAEDLTQVVFVKVLEALPRYQARGVPFGGWLFRLARNVVIDFVRTRHEHAGLDTALDRPSVHRGPDEEALTRTDIETMRNALAGLTDEQREAISLRYFAGLTTREVAIAMNRQEGTVRGLQFRAIAALRRAMGLEPDRQPIDLPRRAGARRAAR